jgi:hypothetical protein
VAVVVSEVERIETSPQLVGSHSRF